MKCLKRILTQNVTENISNHSPGEHKSLAVPPDCEVKKKKRKKNPKQNCSRAETQSKRSSRSVDLSESDQVRYMWGAFVEGLVSSNSCDHSLISSNR